MCLCTAANEASKAEKTSPPKAAESSSKSASGIEDLFKDSPSLTPVAENAEKPKKDVKNDIMSLFEKVCDALLCTITCSGKYSISLIKNIHFFC